MFGSTSSKIMVKNKAVLSEVKREVKKLQNQIKRDKKTLVSSETVFFAEELSASIRSDRAQAKKDKEKLKSNSDWPFPNFNKIV